MNHRSFGHFYRFTLLGGSHEPFIGVEIDGIPSGTPLDTEALGAFLRRRMPGQDAFSSPRQETDEPRFESGVKNGIFTGDTVRIIIPNQDAREKDYEALRHVPRPGHADWPAYVKYGQIPPGGGHFSGRMTAAYCLAGGIALQLLEAAGITIRARILSIGGVPAAEEDAVNALLRDAQAQGDSLGGVIQCEIQGLPIGLGSHPFGGLENRLAAAVFGIPAVKGLTFGDGFSLAEKRGSQANDPYRVEKGQVILSSNHCGGVLGGMACGTPLLFQLAFKPTPSIAWPQDSVNLETLENVSISVRGRHDVCIVPRALPVVEAAAAVALLDALWEEQVSRDQDLNALRRQIDAADRQIGEAFGTRMAAVDAIAAYKKAHELPVEDLPREAALLEKLSQRCPDYVSEIRALYERILKISKERQL